ncbi:MAG: transposon-encoded TnpW family protein [Ruminiclostridium sp.]|nr:transposon-encoded TnpW family protein [Ruminiclostridium sp.]
MRRNELITNAVVANTAETKTEPQPVSVSEYKIGHTTYIVRTFFNPNGTESLEEMVKRLIMKDVAKLSA